jgi:hypothetical protein
MPGDVKSLVTSRIVSMGLFDIDADSLHNKEATESAARKKPWA